MICVYIQLISTQMQAQIEGVSKSVTKHKNSHSLARTWLQFTDRAMDLLVENPTVAKFVLKYVPKTHKFVLKVTDGNRIVIKKCKTDQLEQVEKFTLLAGRALTNEGNRKIEEKLGEDKDKKKKDKKKKK